MTFEQLTKEVKELKALKEWGAYRQKWKELIDKHEEVKEIFESWTVKKLSSFVGRREKKATLVKMAVDHFYVQYTYPFDEACISTRSGSIFDKRTDHEVRINFWESYTAERFQKYLERQVETKKAIENPVTLDQFRVKNSAVGLTNAEAVEFYRLIAISQVNATKKEIEIPEIKTAKFRIVEAYHDKKNIPLFVAQLTERVELDEFKELRSRAKKFGGYYSKFARGNAKPGFQFESIEKANQFAGIEEADTEGMKAEAEAAAAQSTAERLRDLADRWEQEGENSLRADRLDNTVRRARMAAIAEERAGQRIERAKTLRNIADALDTGQAGALAGIKYATDLETLLAIRSRARYQYIAQNKVSPDNYPAFDLPGMLKFVQWPGPMLHPDLLRRAFEPHQGKKGYKLAINRILKKAKGDNPVQVLSIQSDIKKCLGLIGSEWERSHIEDAFIDHMRMRRMGFNNRAHLIGALAELEKHLPSNETPEYIRNRNIDREFVGRKIPGFFPTPESLIMHMMTMIDFPAGAKVAEPSAGLGHLAKLLPDPDCYEINSDLAEALQKKGFRVVGRDWLEATEQYDRIVMNPPFENRQAEAHTRHAYKLLRPSGELVAVLPANVSEDFAKWAQERGTLYGIRENEFISAFRRTGVNIRLVHLEKQDDE